MKTSLKIEPSMSLQALAECMGGATNDEAYEMRERLMWDYYGKTVSDVPEEKWLYMIDEAVEAAAQ